MKKVFCDIAVVGAGPAGLAAAAAALKSGAENVILVEQRAEVLDVKNSRLGTQRKRTRRGGDRKSHSLQESMGEMDFTCYWETRAMQIRGKSLLCINQEGILQIYFSALILAMGYKSDALEGSLHECCFPVGFYTAKKVPQQIPCERKSRKGVVILGSDDDSMLLAHHLAQKGVHVRGVVESLPEMIGSAANKEKCLDPFRIPLFLSHTVVDVWGTGQIESVTLAPVGSGQRIQMEKAFVLPCDTLAFSKREASWAVDIVLDKIPCGIKVNYFKQTQIPWVFACGDLVHPYEENERAVREGETAGRYAVIYARQGLPNVWNGMEAGEEIPGLPHAQRDRKDETNKRGF